MRPRSFQRRNPPGYDPYEKKLLGITAMTALMGKKKFEEVLGPFIVKPQGKAALVRIPISGRRSIQHMKISVKIKEEKQYG